MFRIDVSSQRFQEIVTLKSLVTIMLVHEDIIYKRISQFRSQFRMGTSVSMDCALFWFSRGPKLAGVKEKLCICEFCGRSLRTAGSPDIVWGRKRRCRASELPNKCATSVQRLVFTSVSHRSYSHIASLI